MRRGCLRNRRTVNRSTVRSPTPGANQLVRGLASDASSLGPSAKPSAWTRELVATVRANGTIDWTVREDVRAQLRVLVRRILRKHGHPPDKQKRRRRRCWSRRSCCRRDGQSPERVFLPLHQVRCGARELDRAARASILTARITREGYAFRFRPEGVPLQLLYSIFLLAFSRKSSLSRAARFKSAEQPVLLGLSTRSSFRCS